ncbi:MAG: protein phosphatase CheZ [Sphingomonadales bacterium]
MNETAFGVTVEQRIETIRQERGDNVNLDAVAEVVSNILGTLHGDVMTSDQTPGEDMADDVESDLTQLELLPLLTREFREDRLAESVAHLHEVVAESEDATNVILEAGEALEQLADSVDEEVAASIGSFVTKVYQASNFQDISGQRITKALSTFQLIAEKLEMLAAIIGPDKIESLADHPEDELTEYEEFLHGPQLRKEANSQDEIDALLASFD